MANSAVVPAALDEFFRRWEASGAAERANYSMFLNELCDLLEVPRPDPTGPDDEKNAYVFERAVPSPNPDGSTTVKRIDLYKRDCFVLEAKQGSDKAGGSDALTLSPPKRLRRGTAIRGTAGWDAAMYEAKGQAELYGPVADRAGRTPTIGHQGGQATLAQDPARASPGRPGRARRASNWLDPRATGPALPAGQH